ncbi:hypothetical protein AVEN_173200-1 [Araneus ventricosus]|uniref:DUF659 domain-containing protein n=1 Tax=Araneus ventricosus TaxID=182803 RepID=A0A4Y2TVT2_ARAVE|nr:hypothetical protein AVEN_173200-1 [Araneus ventricosus]
MEDMDLDIEESLTASSEKESSSENETNSEDTLCPNYQPGPFKECKRGNLEFATVHWDGKLLPATTRNKKVDRLPVIISANGQEHLLGVPQLTSCSGDNMAAAIYNLLAETKLLDTVQALWCDTTVSNTGRIKGACVLLERKLGKDLIYLPCRHPIYELVLKSAFEACITMPS